MKTRQRCATPSCRHAPRVHSEAACLLCGCARWLDSKVHTWREDVTQSWFMATHAWLLARKAASAGYVTEMTEFEEHHPRPRLADFMRALSPGTPPEELEHLLAQFDGSDVCSACNGTGHQNQIERKAS